MVNGGVKGGVKGGVNGVVKGVVKGVVVYYNCLYNAHPPYLLYNVLNFEVSRPPGLILFFLIID